VIHYRPTDGDAQVTPLRARPRTCFLMTQLGGTVPPPLDEIRERLRRVLAAGEYDLVDADSVITGKDFLLKIWEMIVAVPLGIALLHEDMRPETIANVFYEMGLMQAYGKETLVVKTRGATVPSDFVRTEYVEYGPDFDARIGRFLAALDERATYYALIADQLEKNPLLSIDYLRRADLLTGDRAFTDRAVEIFEEAGVTGRAKNSVEMMLVNFLSPR
jgi:hypothetical protein